MGAQQSRTRKLTVQNDDPTSVIKVSDDVVQRIRNSQTDLKPPEPQYQAPPTGPEVPVGTPPVFIYEPSITTVQLRQANVAELKKNDKYWEQRLKHLQENHKKINAVMEEEYRTAVDELGGKHVTLSASRMMPPCQKSKMAVMKCYKQYPREPMKCAKIVEEFQACVDSKRATLIANRG